MTRRPTYFATPEDFRAWLVEHHQTVSELLVGFHRKRTGTPSVTWPESVDEALCVGWIDGVRRRVDEHRYAIRFTPRRRGSIWSAINIRRVTALKAEGRMLPAGLEAFEARTENRSVVYSYEQRPIELPDPYAKVLKRTPKAWAFFQAQPPSYRKQMIWRIVSAKREETRQRRVKKLVAASKAGRRLD